MNRARLALLLGGVAASIAACGGAPDSDSDQAAGARVVPIRNVEDVATRFDAEKGKPRLVLLLSPT